MKNLTFTAVAKLLKSSVAVKSAAIKNIVTNSKEVQPGDLFIAIAGDNFDGHSFVTNALEHGAAGAVVERPVDGAPPDKQILVPDTKQAYLQIGGFIRDQSRAKVIAITGSAGKTTTKEMMKLVFSKFASVYATGENFNNSIGVAMTLCAMPADVDIAIVEVGMSQAGHIANRAKFVKPDIAVVTNVFPMHLEFFDSVEGIAHAKAEIFSALSKEGVAVINRYSNFFDILEHAAREHTSHVTTYGNGGNPLASNALCVLTVADLLGFDLKKAAEAINEFGALEGRGKVHKLSLPGTRSKFRLIDDSYSAQPESLKLAIENLGEMPANRKIAVVGKMSEIGERSREMHIEIGKALAKTDIALVIGVCPETRDILDQLDVGKFETHYFETSEGLDEYLLGQVLRDGDVVLIKGSHYGSKLFKTAKSLIEKCAGGHSQTTRP